MAKNKISYNIPEVLYYYCDIKTFMSIIESNTIWLTDIKFMNDTMEGKWFFKKFREICTKDKRFDHSRKAYNPKYITPLIDPIMTERLDFFEESHMQHTSDIHIICFSEHNDSLSLWRGYADDGKGIAIGFDTKSLGAYIFNDIEEFAPYLNQHWLILSKVKYDEQEYLSSIEKHIDFILNPISRYLVSVNSPSIELHSILCKNIKFSEENEWRLIAKQPDFFDENDRKEFGDKIERRKKFRLTNYGISSYLEYRPDSLTKLPIQEIVIGSKCITPKETIEYYLNHHGFNMLGSINVYSSELTYR